MKAKNLVLGSPVYRAERDKIIIVRVIGLKMVVGDVRISLSGYSGDKDVPPDAEAIIPQNDYEVRYYFDLKSAQVRQLRLRWDAIEARKKNLEMRRNSTPKPMRNTTMFLPLNPLSNESGN